VYLHGFVDADQLQQRLLHLIQQLGEEDKHLLAHPRRILGRRRRKITERQSS